MTWTWIPITVVMQPAGTTTPPPPPVIAQSIDSFSADSSTVVLGKSVTLSWKVSNANTVYLNGSAVAAIGSQTVTPSVNTTYTLEADGSAAPAKQSLSITVTQPTVPPQPGTTMPTIDDVLASIATLQTTAQAYKASLIVVPAQTINSFSASPSSVVAGASATLSWTTSNATAVRLNGISVATSGSQTVTPSVNTTYTLQADGSVPTISQSLSVAVTQPTQGNGTVSIVGTNTLDSVKPSMTLLGAEVGNMGQAGVVSNGSQAFAPNLGAKGSLVLPGGGHGDYGGNEFYVLDLATFAWARFSDPSNSATATNDPRIDWMRGELPDGSPMACHGFNVIAVVPGGTNGKGLLLRIAAPSLGVGPGGPSGGYAHVADLGLAPIAKPTDVWKRFSQNACPGDVNGYVDAQINALTRATVPRFHTYDVSNGVVWCGYASGFHGLLAKLDLATKMYSAVTLKSQYDWGFMPQACAHPVRNLMLYVAGSAKYTLPQTFALRAVDLAHPENGCLTLKVGGDVPPTALISVYSNYMAPWGFDWNTDGDFGAVYAGDESRSIVYRLDAPSDPINGTWTFTKIALPSPLPALAPGYAYDPTQGKYVAVPGAPIDSALDAVYGHWRYCPSIKSFALVTTTRQKVGLWTP